VAAVLAAWWLGEAMTWRQGAGAALLAVAMAVLVRRPRTAGVAAASH
jgi:drug/metabolite transporter (DMT)-like permease